MPNISKRENLEVYGIVLVAVIFFLFALWWNWTNPHVTVKYDCRLAEMSPDIPLEVKNQCRQLRARTN